MKNRLPNHQVFPISGQEEAVPVRHLQPAEARAQRAQGGAHRAQAQDPAGGETHLMRKEESVASCDQM